MRMRARLVGLVALLGVLIAGAQDADRMLRTLTTRYGNEPQVLYRNWREMVAQGSGQTDAEKLRRVNDFFNRRIRFSDDTVVWSQVDYWATPLETIGRAAGDCEDFTIAKYFSLVELGVPANQLRFTYVRARIGAPDSGITQAHMVLSYYASPTAEPLVLDNLISDIRPASRRPDLSPVFSFNSDGVFMAGAARPTSSVDRLARWTDLLLRMKTEGYEPLK